MDEELAQLRADVAALHQRAVFALSDDELRIGLAELTAIAGMIESVRVALVREVDGRGLPATLGYPSTVTWLRETQRMSVATAKQAVELGTVLDVRPALAEALRSGLVSVDQARVIGTTVTSLDRDGIDADTVREAETLLLMHANILGPGALTRAGERILGHVAPEIAEALKRKLDQAEARARIDHALNLSLERDLQRTRISGNLTAEGAAIVQAALEPLIKPRPGLDGARDDRSAAARRADALVEICRFAPALPADCESPTLFGNDAAGDHVDVRGDVGGRRSSGHAADETDAAGAVSAAASSDGVPASDATGAAESASSAPRPLPRLTVTVAYDVLTKELGYGLLDSGLMVTAESVRRLACDAAIIPALLGSQGQVLDLGRSARLWTGPARQAIIIRDRDCVFPGCDRPPAWCDVHHCTYYSLGGRTDRDNGALVCGFHHQLIHHGGWEVRIAADGLAEVIPPAHIDPERKPLRNTYHRRP